MSIAYRSGLARRLRLAASMLRVIACLVALSAAAPVRAQPARLGFGQFKHTRWAADEGAPAAIRQIAQTPDGYLWLAAADGLFRFDGVTFERVSPPVGSAMDFASPSELLVSRGGELWVGYREGGGVAVYRAGRLQDMRLPHPPVAITVMAETPDGAVWAGSAAYSNRLWRLAANRWTSADERLGLPPGGVAELQVGPDGTLWASLSLQDAQRGSRLAYLPPNVGRFRQSGVHMAVFAHIRFDRGGTLWVSDSAGTRILLDRTGRVPAGATRFPVIPGMRFATLAFDRSGGIWGTTRTAGIFYIPSAGALRRSAEDRQRRFTAADGLTSDLAVFPFVDREGNVWIGGALGLDQFRVASVVREPEIPMDPIEGHAIAGSADGAVYIASAGALYRAAPHQPPRPVFRTSAVLYALCRARGDGVWVIRSHSIVRVHGTSSEAFPAPLAGAWTSTCAEDGRGRLWLALVSGEILLRDRDGWHRPDGAFRHMRVRELVAIPSGDIAFRTDAGEVAIVRRDGLSPTILAAPDIRSPSMIEAGARDVFVSGANTLLRLRDGTWRRIDGRQYPWLTRLRGLAQTAAGDTWLLGRDGISRVATADLDHAFENPGTRLTRRLLDARDGFVTTMQHSGFLGTQAVAGSDGRVWFVDRTGADVVDPANRPINTLPPTVLVRALSAGGTTYRDPAGLLLPPSTRSLDIAFTATSLTVPQRVRFRYMLDGVDRGWVDPGTRRLASYANLGAGHYHFRVIAANEDGVWNDQGATLDFDIRATFRQSWPFRLLCGAAMLALIWLAYALRLRSVARRIGARMAERIEERERIARELHDTLLQSVQALTLRFQLALDDLPPRAAARSGLTDAIERADRAIAEGRDRVQSLRSLQQRSDLEQIMQEIVARQGFAPGIDCAIVTVGAARALQPLVLEDVSRIANEALFNALRHAFAKHISVEIAYGPNLRIRFVDDGVGIDLDVAESGGRQGHFGLAGMRERARKLGGSLAIRRLAESGTEIALTVPGSIAYQPADRCLLRRLWGRR